MRALFSMHRGIVPKSGLAPEPALPSTAREWRKSAAPLAELISVLFNVVTSTLLDNRADFLTQYLNRDRQQPYSHNFRSTALMAAAGAAAAAPAGLLLCQWMDAVWPSPLLLAAAGKFTIDQVVGCALWQAFYCAIPGNEGYRDALAAGLQRAAAGADDGVRAAFAHAAAAASLVLPVPAVP
jgi:hypothetical protein